MNKESKEAIRRRVWDLLMERKVAAFPLPPHGRIPNFMGAEQAALKLAELREWRNAEVIKVNPDSPQKHVRLLALREGKKVLMATPRLRQGFILLDPHYIPESRYDYAATIKGAFRYGRLLSLNELRRFGTIDMIVMGSVAVDLKGNRLGKGKGYAELEYAILRELSLAEENTPIATTVHELQIVDRIPSDPYDVSLDYIVTPRRIIKIENRRPRPKGVIWGLLQCRKLEEIPLLQELAKLKGVRTQCTHAPKD